MTDITTCQICGRPIKSASGLIAHHGYKRPGDGWQTRSCAGARHLPYEVSRDYIPVVMSGVREWLKDTENKLTEHIAKPPDIIRLKRYNGKEYEYVKPASFQIDGYHSGSAQSYDYAFDRVQRQMEMEIRAATDQIAFLQARFDNWKLQA